jgi:hypothetical protein
VLGKHVLSSATPLARRLRRLASVASTQLATRSEKLTQPSAPL